MPTFYLEKDGTEFDVEAESLEEAIGKVNAYLAENAEPAPEPTPEPTPEPAPEPAPEPNIWDRVESAWGRTQDTAADLLTGLAETTMDTADLAAGGGFMGYTPPLDPIAALRRQFGVADDASVQDLLAPEMQPRNMQFSENPNVSTAVKAIGGLGSAGLVSLPTAGARMTGKAINTAEEVVEGTLGLGAGLKQGTEAVAEAAPKLTGLAVPKEQADFSDDAWVQEVVQEINTSTAAQAATRHMDEWQRIDEAYEESVKAADLKDPKNKEAALKRADERRREARAAIEADVSTNADLRHGHSFRDQHVDGVIQSFARMYDLPIAEATALVYRSGGVDAPSSFAELAALHNKQMREDLFDSVLDRRNVERAERGKKVSKDDTTIKGFELYARPAIGLLRDLVGSGFANKVESVMVEGMAKRDELVSKYTSMQGSVAKVAQWADNPAIKRQFMNLDRTGVEGRAALIADARQNLDADGFRAFMDIIDDTFDNQRRVQQYLMRDDQTRDAVHWGIAKLPEELEAGSAAARRAEQEATGTAPNTIGPLAERVRKDANKMTDAELATYDNPIWSNFGQLFDTQDLIALSRGLNVPRGMVIGEGLKQFNDLLARHVKHVTKDQVKADHAATIMHGVIVGSRRQVGDLQRAFMNQAYGGTLGHFKSAFLQLHDNFITAMRTSPADTIVGMFNGKQTGLNAAEFGLSTNTYNTREFREGLDAGFLDRMRGREGASGKAVRVSEWYADKAFKWSAFQHMDRWGKGTNLRATHRNMQKLVGDPEAFAQRYGDFFTRQELAEVRGALTNKTPWNKMTARQQEILGRGLLANLGQQQLISAASRPLQYLNNPNMRWAYAMRGFAIVQSDLAKAMVIDRAAAGDARGAGEALGKYMSYVVGGYVIADTIRDYASSAAVGAMAEPFTLDESGHADASSNAAPEMYPEKIMSRALEGALGPATFNVFGDPYTLGRAEREGIVDVGLGQFAPPTGFLGTLGTAAGAGAKDLRTPGGDAGTFTRAVLTELAEVVPGFGREVRSALKLQEKEDLYMQDEKMMRDMYIEDVQSVDKLRKELRDLER